MLQELRAKVPAGVVELTRVPGLGPKTAIKALQHWPDLTALFEEVERGVAETRFHRLVAASGLAADEFRQLDAFVAALPVVDQPDRPRPCPERATEAAQSVGMDPQRLLACFC